MWHSFFLAAWRNLGRNRLHGALTILSLGLALAVVILLGLVVRNEWRFDRFLPGSDKTYLLVLSGTAPEGVPFTTDKVPVETAGQLSGHFRGVTTVARMIYGGSNITTVDGHRVAAAGFGLRAAQVPTAAVDPAFFTALPLPVLYGDLDAAARAPDGVVISESLARTYFHTADAVGRRLSITLPGDPAAPVTGRIGAVLRDLPPESHLNTQLFLTGGLGAERFAAFAAGNGCRGCIGSGVATYVRLMPDVAPQAVGRWLDQQVPHSPDLVVGLRGARAAFTLVPVSVLHRRTDIPQQTYTVPSGLFLAVSGFAGLVMIMAGGNFILLMIGHGASRGLEIGVRAALGARRRDLVLQLVAEAVLYALAGTVLAMALVEQTLPFVNPAIGRTIAVDGWRDSLVLLGVFGLVCVIGIGAGLGPALTLAARSPARLLREPSAGAQGVAGRAYGRSGLVAVQFAMLTSLVLVSIAFHRQIALEETPLGIDARHVLIVTDPPPEVVTQIAGLPGVVAIGRSAPQALFGRSANIDMETARGGKGGITFSPVDSGFFSLYGTRPLAGSLVAPPPFASRPGWVILNLAAVRAFGLATPAGAIGQRVRFTGRGGVTMEDDVVAGVVPDIALNAALGSLPTAYQIRDVHPALVSIRVRPGAEADVEQAIRTLWARRVYAPMEGFAIADWRHSAMAPLTNLARILAAITLVGGLIAGVGLFQLSAYSVRRRAREIALRQAFGARPWQTVGRVMWDQTPPVLLAIATAWPIATLLTRPWLHGFAHYVAIGPVTLLVAGSAVLGLAWLTTGLHALWAGLVRPGRVLRHV